LIFKTADVGMSSRENPQLKKMNLLAANGWYERAKARLGESVEKSMY
jgi:hypothetical protein